MATKKSVNDSRYAITVILGQRSYIYNYEIREDAEARHKKLMKYLFVNPDHAPRFYVDGVEHDINEEEATPEEMALDEEMALNAIPVEPGFTLADRELFYMIIHTTGSTRMELLIRLKQVVKDVYATGDYGHYNRLNGRYYQLCTMAPLTPAQMIAERKQARREQDAYDYAKKHGFVLRQEVMSYASYPHKFARRHYIHRGDAKLAEYAVMRDLLKAYNDHCSEYR